MGAFFMGDLNPEACVALLQGTIEPCNVRSSSAE
jgi:hypothetical protein